MRSAINNLVREIKGHFEFESGHHGDTWLELESLFLDPGQVRPIADSLAQRIAACSPQVVCGPLTEGAFLALMVSLVLDLPFIYSRRHRSSDGVTYAVPFPMEREIAGRRIAIVDDVVNAGSALGHTINAIRLAGATPVVIGAIAVYGDMASDIADRHQIALESLESHPQRIWQAAACPLCARGIPVVPAG